MHHFEIDLAAHETEIFDAAFWSYLAHTPGESEEGVVFMRSSKTGEREHRTIAFESQTGVTAFEAHWRRHRPKPR